MSKKVQIVVLCEDAQTFSFARKYLLSKGFDDHKIRARISPPARGSAYSFVLHEFPLELQEMRKASVERKLLAILDEDGREDHSLSSFEKECINVGVAFRAQDEPAAILIPKRNIETWLMFLSDEKPVREDFDYKEKIHPGNGLIACKRHVAVLNKMCQKSQRQDWPSSLGSACSEMRRIL